MLSALLWTYSWFPGFLAGLLAGRGAVPLAVVTVVIGAVAKSVFHSLFSPMVVIDDWDPAIVNLVQGLLAIVAAAVAAFAGQCMSRRRGWVTAKD
ncbi:putative membrane protein [Povalibacter uvarum]|uniref:Putative membrane protein n=1 Tax=Povalibacter uvarum TaxID=732238 RepID=A0A841HWB6_9GAMM|nr:hypothetical protein [Povalibacter uvarum]MBB6096242.1 putative membrane protein [Povalibacter uvarum]